MSQAEYEFWSSVGTFSDWVNVQRDTLLAEKKRSPEQVLLSDDGSKLCEWLGTLVKQTRKADGREYTPNNLYLPLAGLQHECVKRKGELPH